MTSWCDKDSELNAACELVGQLIEITDKMEAAGIMRKEVREIRGYLGTGPHLKLIHGGKG